MSKRGAHSNLSDSGTKPPAKRGDKRKRNAFSRVLIIIGIILLAIALGLFVSKMYSYYKGDKIYQGASDRASLTDDYQLDVDWAGLLASNDRIVGWVTIPDTNIDYPIAQADDNDYYLHHAYDLEVSSLGCPFLDYENSADLTDNSNFIYGHNMRNGSMFHDLAGFTDDDYFASHRYAYIATPYRGTKRYRIVGAFLAAGDEKVRKMQFADLSDYRSYINELWSRCETTDASFDINQVTRTVVLSTCSYQFNDARTLLICVEVDDSGNLVNYPMSPKSLTPRISTSTGTQVIPTATAS